MTQKGLTDVELVGHRCGASVAQELEPGRRVGQRYRSQCGTEVPDFHNDCEVSAWSKMWNKTRL